MVQGRPRVAVPGARGAELVKVGLLREALGAQEEHVLEEVGEPVHPGGIVELPDRDAEGGSPRVRLVVRDEDNLEPVREGEVPVLPLVHVGLADRGAGPPQPEQPLVSASDAHAPSPESQAPPSH